MLETSALLDSGAYLLSISALPPTTLFEVGYDWGLGKVNCATRGSNWLTSQSGRHHSNHLVICFPTHV